MMFAAKRRRPEPVSTQDEALSRRLYEACQRLAPLEPALAWASRLTPWNELPAWSRRLLSAASAAAIRRWSVAAVEEDALAESRALVDEWIETESDDVDVLREMLVQRIAERLHARDAWIARLTAVLIPADR